MISPVGFDVKHGGRAIILIARTVSNLHPALAWLLRPPAPALLEME
jgi:hypothetical protein